MLILFSSPTPGDRAEGEPEPLAAAREHAHEDPGDERPEEEVEGVHRVGAAEGQGDRGEAGGEAGQSAGRRAAAERQGDPAGEPDGRRHRERRHHAQREVRLPRDLGHEPRDPAHERRVIDVAPAGPPAAGHVVELVPEDAVAGQKGQVEEEDARGRRPLGEAFRPAHPTACRPLPLHGLPLPAATAAGACSFPVSACARRARRARRRAPAASPRCPGSRAPGGCGRAARRRCRRGSPRG